MKRDWMVEQYVKEQVLKRQGVQFENDKAKQIHDKFEKARKQMKKKFYKVGEWVWIVPRNQKGLVIDIKPKEKKVVVQYSYFEKGVEKWAGNEYKFWQIDKTQQPNLHGEKGLDYAFVQVRKFQRKMDQPVGDKPQPLDVNRAMFRTAITSEELVEFLYSSVEGKTEEFNKLVNQLKESIDVARDKQKNKNEKVESVLVGQVDAAIDQIYLSLGTLVELGVYPQEIMNIVQEANMAKIFPDGKPHFNEHGKVIKPDGWVAPEPKLKKALEGQIRRAEQRNNK